MSEYREPAFAVSTLPRTWANTSRGTPIDAAKVRMLLDEVAVRLPNDDLGHALYEWCEEVTRLVEGD